MLANSELELVRHSRLITIAVRSKLPELAAALANAYAEAIESFTDEENKKRCDKAVAQIHQQVEKQKRADDDLAARLLKFRTENKIDNLQAEQAILSQRLQTTAADVLKYEKRVTVANEWVKVLQVAQAAQVAQVASARQLRLHKPLICKPTSQITLTGLWL